MMESAPDLKLVITMLKGVVGLRVGVPPDEGDDRDVEAEAGEGCAKIRSIIGGAPGGNLSCDHG